MEGLASSFFVAHAGITFNEQNTIAIGGSFYDRPGEQNLTIVHEVFHLFFNTPSHIAIAEKLNLGNFRDDDAASKALDTWLSTDCGKKKQ